MIRVIAMRCGLVIVLAFSAIILFFFKFDQLWRAANPAGC